MGWKPAVAEPTAAPEAEAPVAPTMPAERFVAEPQGTPGAEAREAPAVATVTTAVAAAPMPTAVIVSEPAPTAVVVSEPAPRVTPTPAPAPAPNPASIPTPAPAPQIDVPTVSLDLPADSGLVMVETSHRSETPVAAESEATSSGRARRQRVKLVEEPLQFVETRKDVPPAA